MGGWSSGKSSFFPPKHKSSVRCMRRATPMPFVVTRRHRAMIRQWRKDPLARPRPYFPCRRSSSVEGEDREGRVSTIATCLLTWTAGAWSTPGPGLFEQSTAQQAAQKRTKRGSAGPIAHYHRPAAKCVIWLQAAALVGTLPLSRCLSGLFPLQLSSIFSSCPTCSFVCRLNT